MAIARLHIESGPERGREVDLSRSSVVGRSSSCDIVLADDSCSRMHVRLTPENGRCRVEDLGSTNGTLVNGERISLGYLEDGDEFVIGDSTIRFREKPFDGASTVILPGAAKGDARIAIEALSEGPVQVPADRAKGVLDATRRMLDATRGVPERTSIARALCSAVAQLLTADRSAVLLFRPGSADPQDARVISIPEMRLDPDRPWVARALKKRRALVLEEDGRSGSPLYGLVAPHFHGDEPVLLIYADRRREQFSESDLVDVRHLLDTALALIDTASLHETIRSELMALRAQSQIDHRIIGESAAHRECMEQVLRTAKGSSAVLLIGETGSGKAVFARFVHDSSVRSDGPFVTVNCSADAAGFLAQELLGTDRNTVGPYGADHIGSLERAAGGTLFLDEIDTLDLASQAKLASVLRERKITHESGRQIPVDVRLVAASDRDLASRSQSGSFHEDLLALLALGTIRLPPLRERTEDIPLLADHFIKTHARRMNRLARRVSKEAMAAMIAYEWPGNVRELSNVMERAVVLCKDEEIPLSLLPFTIEGPVTEEELSLDHAEKIAIARALRHCNYRKGQAAKTLGISWPTLNKKINEYGIEIPERGSTGS